MAQEKNIPAQMDILDPGEAIQVGKNPIRSANAQTRGKTLALLLQLSLGTPLAISCGDDEPSMPFQEKEGTGERKKREEVDTVYIYEEKKEKSGCEGTASNGVAIIVGIAFVAGGILRLIPGQSGPERLISGAASTAGFAVGGLSMLAGGEPTTALVTTTLLSGGLTVYNIVR